VSENPEISKTIGSNGVRIRYVDAGKGAPIVLLHGSGPGVSAWANWRLTIPDLAKKFRVLAPDLLGFGFTERPKDNKYDMDRWLKHAVGFLDAVGLGEVGLVGNSFGSALALHLADRHPKRIKRLVLMGAVGVRFQVTEGLDKAWGYEPSFESMRELMSYFAYDRALVTDELAELRYKASIRPGFQESFSAMFPAPRQRWIDAIALPEERLRALPHETLVIHGREDKIIPLSNAYQLHERIERSQLHVFGRCGHWTQIEHSKRFNELVADFFSEGA